MKYSLLQFVVQLLVALITLEARCPNSCSGHGLCGVGNTCSCFDGWNGGAADCSFRTCPSGTAWVDKAYAVDQAHQVMECSNAGICDRKSGLCKCFEGFTGTACQRNTCPNDCSAHGSCATIKDISLYSGPDYDSTSEYAGDGKGVVYTNWDKDSIQFCECDDGFFGADCSLVMCPKGDDPLTSNQEYRKIRMHVKTTGSVDLSGQLGFRFHGKTIFFPLEYYYSNVTCNDKFAFLGKFAHVGCSQVTVNEKHFYYELVFYSWPIYPKDNNLYSHDGNPSITEFFCDTTYSSHGTYCDFEDLVAINVREYAYCSNRGTCSFTTGACSCIDGYGGPACSNATSVYQSGSSSSPGMIVNINAYNFTSSAIHVQTAKSPAADFKMFEAVANGETIFFIRGDGLVGMSKLQTLTGGQTITGGGLSIEKDGCTIFDGGLGVFNYGKKDAVATFTSKYTGQYSTALYSTLAVNTYGSNPTGHYFLIGRNRDKVRLRLRADGAVMINGGGLHVTAGTTIFSGGLTVSGGTTINSNGLVIESGGMIMTGGLTINSNGIRVGSGGIQVIAGGVSISSVGLRVVSGISVLSGGVVATGGISVNTLGLKVTGGLSVNSMGMQITGGMTIHNSGMVITTGGLSITQGGMYITTSGLTIASGGVRVLTGGVTVTTGGLTVNHGTAYFREGMRSDAGLTVRVYPAVLYGGAAVSAGMEVTLGMTVHDWGMSVSGGLTVNYGMAKLLDGLYISNGLTVWGYVDLQSNPTIFSDRRLKENVTKIDDALEKVTSVRGVYFNWIQDGSHNMTFDNQRHIGVIAQDVKKVLPELVKGDEDDKDGGFLKVDYLSMVPVVVEAISDLNDLIKEVRGECLDLPPVMTTDGKVSQLELLKKEVIELRNSNIEIENIIKQMRQDINDMKMKAL